MFAGSRLLLPIKTNCVTGLFYTSYTFIMQRFSPAMKILFHDEQVCNNPDSPGLL